MTQLTIRDQRKIAGTPERPFGNRVSIATEVAANIIIMKSTPLSQSPRYVRGEQAQDLLNVADLETPVANAVGKMNSTKKESSVRISNLKSLVPPTLFGIIFSAVAIVSIVAEKLSSHTQKFQNGFTVALTSIAIVAISAFSIAGIVKCIKDLVKASKLKKEADAAESRANELMPAFQRAKTSYESRWNAKYPSGD